MLTKSELEEDQVCPALRARRLSTDSGVVASSFRCAVLAGVRRFLRELV